MDTGPVDPTLSARPATVVELEPGRIALPAPTLGDRLQELRGRVETACREDPVKTLAIAIAVGWVCGKTLHFALSRPPKPARRRPEADELD